MQFIGYNILVRSEQSRVEGIESDQTKAYLIISDLNASKSHFVNKLY
jgi:hypothetical protein